VLDMPAAVAWCDFDLFVVDMSDLLAALRLFVRLAPTGSSLARLGLSQPSGS